MRSKYKSALVALMAMLTVGAVAAGPAFASGKPTAETKPATNASLVEAKLNGVVNPNGAATKYYFEYGETTAYGKKTAEVSAGSGTTNLEESTIVKELEGETTYHFRIVATNSNGTTDGSDEWFGRPAVETRQATRVSGTGATLKGAVDPDGLETKYYFEYGTEKGKYTTKTLETSAGSGKSSLEESQAITGLTEGKHYYYRIVAKNGKSGRDGTERTFQAGPQPEFENQFGGGIGQQGFKGTISSASIQFDGTVFSYNPGTITGKIVGPSEVAEVVITLPVEGTGKACHNTAGKPVELVTNQLVGRIGYVSKSAKTVGLLLEPAVSGPIADCEDETFGKQELIGSVIGSITPVNTVTKSFNFDIETEGTGKGAPLQRIEKFEGEEVLHYIEEGFPGGEGDSRAGLLAPMSLETTNEEKLQVKA